MLKKLFKKDWRIEPVLREKTAAEKEQEYIGKVLYASSIAALAANLAKCDGPISLDEIKSFEESFLLPDIGVDYQKLFSEASSDKIDFEHYAVKIKNFCGDQIFLITSVLDGLFRYAACDGAINFQEVIFLKKVSLIFDLDNEFFKSKLKEHIIPRGANAFEILAVDRKISYDDLKRAYRNAVQLYHPDRMVSNMPLPDVISIANERLAKINGAYNEILEERNFA